MRVSSLVALRPPRLLLVSLLAWTLPALASDPPFLRAVDRVNPVPRPYRNRVDVSTHTTLYFEIVVPAANGQLGAVDTDSITANLTPAGGAPVPVLAAGRVFQPGFSGRIQAGVQDAFADEVGDAVYVELETPLDTNRLYTVEVWAQTLDGVPIDPAQDSWSFTTRPPIADPTVSWSVNVGAPTVHWEGWFFTGILKPDFNTSRLFDQLDSYDLMDTVSAINPDAWSLQRDWPLTSDYWHNGVFDGNPNPVREMETRQIVAIENKGPRTELTVVDLEEAPLYGIPPNRPLSDDYHAGDIVALADREKYELAVVQSVDDNKGVVKLDPITTPPELWILDYEGSHPSDNPETPDNFTLPLCYLYKMDPVGTPVYYWGRIDDEWDIVHGQHGRRLQVNFSYTPLALSSEPVPGSAGGHGSISPPKDYLQWHDFVREMVFHLIDRYGQPTETFYYSVGNEHNFPIFWSGGKDGFYELYDYTVNAVLTAFEDRGLDASRVTVGGGEAAAYGGIGWTKDLLYHCSGSADRPGGGIVETNFVCADPLMTGKRSARVQAICDAHGGKGSPMDFVSIHEYEHADKSVSDLNRVRSDALAMDPGYYGDLNVTSFENTPDWIPRPDPASRRIYEGNGYFPTWMADWMHRMVQTAEGDLRYARHEAVVTVWPFDYNGSGQSSITGLIRVDDDGDGTEDRVATIRKGVFNYIEMLAHLNRDLDALPERVVEGIRFGAVRSPSADVHRFLLYNHDKYDTDSSEPTEFTVSLSLTGLPWESVELRRWRLDRDHSSPYHAYQVLPEKDLYAPAEIADLEATDDLEEDGPPLYRESPAGALQTEVPLSVNGVVLLEIREGDLDGDGWRDSGDNCPEDFNPGQENGDGDAAGTVCDCDDANPDATVPATEPADSVLLAHDHGAGVTTLSWAPTALALRYDTIRSGDPRDFEGAGFCLQSDEPIPGATDGEAPLSGASFFYLVRPENECPQPGPLGSDSDGGPRTARSCP